jgi:uncharacterized repeat protein (TIGR03803 family)
MKMTTKILILAAFLLSGRLLHAQALTVLHSFGGTPIDVRAPLVQGTDGFYYGTTYSGGSRGGCGTVFRTDSAGTLTILHEFAMPEGCGPYAGLVQGSDGNYYGSTYYGGGGFQGTLFRMDPAGNVTVLHTFYFTNDGGRPLGTLIQASDGSFYGMTQFGGTGGYGTAFKMTTNGIFTTLHPFANTDGAYPFGGVVEGTDGNFYGTTTQGGASSLGTVFRMDVSGAVTTLYSFAGADGSTPSAGLIQGSDGNFYGTTISGGVNAVGTVFRIDTSGVLTTVHSFDNTNGGFPQAALVQASDGNYYGTTAGGGSLGHGTAFSIDSSGTFSLLHSFTNTDGAAPWAVVQGSDGNFYGTTQNGGAGGLGTVFKMDSAGNVTTLDSFVNLDGLQLTAGLFHGSDGSFYGTTYRGGNGSSFQNGSGTVFKVDSAGSLTTLHEFAETDGSHPYGGLIQATDGNYYGTTSYGYGGNVNGNVFKIDSTGTLTVLYSFIGPEGGDPYDTLVQATDGNFYGTTQYGGANGGGAIFKMDTSGTLTPLHSFSNANAHPIAGLIQASDGLLYGTTTGGGLAGMGSVYKITLAGTFNQIYAFSGADGSDPEAPLVQGTDGLFYGTTTGGGANSAGTVFKIDSAGNLTTLHSFAGLSQPKGGLIQRSDGFFYGTTWEGGVNSEGSIFKIDSAGNYTRIHSFSGDDGGLPVSGLVDGGDGKLYGTTSGGGAGGAGVVFAFCYPHPTPAITTTRCVPASTSGLTASVTAHAGDTYAWTVTGGTLDSGQGTNSITFTSGVPGTLVTISLDESNGTCSGSASTTAEVDFADVPASSPFYNFICTIARNSITAGCGSGNYCPGNSVLRSQMAIFLLRSEHGATYTPLPAVGIFSDVPATNPFAPWIEQLYMEGITGGCQSNPFQYCPNNTVSRAGMAVFLLVAEHGTGYIPPACAGIFTDVACPGAFTNWIEELYNEGITGGCSTNPLMYCPGSSVTRAQMAVFLTATFALP